MLYSRSRRRGTTVIMAGIHLHLPPPLITELDRGPLTGKIRRIQVPTIGTDLNLTLAKAMATFVRETEEETKAVARIGIYFEPRHHHNEIHDGHQSMS